VTELNSKIPSALISGTMLDLPEHRAAVFDACLRVGVTPLTLENAALGSDPLAVCAELLDKADVYIGILAFRYGFVPEGQEKSLTQIEFERAGARGIPRLIFLMSEDHPVRVTDIETGPGAEKLRDFKALARRELLVTEFRSPDELKAAVVTGLVEVLRSGLQRRQAPAALLLLPFDAKLDPLRLFLSDALLAEGIQVLRLDEMRFRSGATWTNAIADAIQAADIILADVTSANPNVMYELGYAHALKKSTILLRASEPHRDIPFDLGGFLYLTYEMGEFASLRSALQSFLRRYLKEERR
jgi:hypothetical protein